MRKLGLFENQKLKEFTKWDSGFQNQRIRKIRKKTLSVTPYLEKTICEKPNLGSGVRLLIRKVR